VEAAGCRFYVDAASCRIRTSLNWPMSKPAANSPACFARLQRSPKIPREFSKIPPRAPKIPRESSKIPKISHSQNTGDLSTGGQGKTTGKTTDGTDGTDRKGPCLLPKFKSDPLDHNRVARRFIPRYPCHRCHPWLKILCRRDSGQFVPFVGKTAVIRGRAHESGRAGTNPHERRERQPPSRGCPTQGTAVTFLLSFSYYLLLNYDIHRVI
jgi:hypothetical protein